MDYKAKETAVFDHLKKYGGNFEIAGYMEQTWGMTSEHWHICNKDTGESFSVYGMHKPDGYSLIDKRMTPAYLKKIKATAETYAKKHFSNFRITTETKRLTININETKEKSQAKANSFVRLISEKFFEMGYTHIWIKFIFSGDSVTNKLHLSSPSTSFYLNKNGKIIRQDVSEKTVSSQVNNDPLSPEQVEQLCAIVYLDDILIAKPEDSLGEIISYLSTCGPDKHLPCEMNKQEWGNIFRSILNDEALCRLQIAHFEDIRSEKPDVLPGFRSVCFMDSNRNAYVIYRGTCGDKEWADNAHGMLQADTVQQKYALKYAVHIKENFNLTSLTVAGHSKGGNKARYVAIVAPDNYVDRCISVDGQGFSPAFVKKYEDNISRRKNIILLAEHRDFVNCLGINPGETVFYRGRRGEKSREYPYGEPLPFFHCPDALRKSDGEQGEEFPNSYISAPINRFVVKFLTDRAYKAHRSNTVNHVITLLMHKKTATPKEIADALSNLLTVFIDMAAKSKDFDEELSQIAFHEQDVIIATLECAFNQKTDQPDHESLLDLFISKFVSTLLLKPVHLINLITVLVKFITFVIEVSKDPNGDSRLIVYLLNLLCTLTEKIIENNHSNFITKKLLQAITNLKNKFEDNQTQNTENENEQLPEQNVFALLDSWKLDLSTNII